MVRVQVRVKHHPNLGWIHACFRERVLERRVLGPRLDRVQGAHAGVDHHEAGRRAERERVDVPLP